MNVALVGSNGYIASFLKTYLKRAEPAINLITVDRTGMSDYVISLAMPEKFDYDALENVEYVIFTAAISSPDKCHDEFEECWKVNVIGTEHFISEALNRGCRVIFFSSDAVFGETGARIAYEDTKTKTGVPYGIMKKHVEDRFCGNNGFKSIRLSYVVSSSDRFVSYCIRCVEDNTMAEIYHPLYRNCVSIHDVADVVLWLLLRWDELDSPFLNVTGTELVSRLQIADELNRLLDGKLRYAVTYPSDDFYGSRARITHMGSHYLYDKGILLRRSFFELLRDEMKMDEEGLN